MNIIDVFCGGDGRIDEANMSSLLGFLFNPNKAHGYEGTALALLFQSISRKLMLNSDFNKKLTGDSFGAANIFLGHFTDIEVILEKRVRRANVGKADKTGNHRDIDLVIKLGDEKGNLRFVLAIENKIKPSSATSVSQLNDEYAFLRSDVDSEMAAVGVSPATTVPILFVYLIPHYANLNGDSPVATQWRNLDLATEPVQNGDFKILATWMPSKDSDFSIVEMAKEMLRMEMMGDISPASLHANLLVRSLISFVLKSFAPNPATSYDASSYRMLALSTEEFRDNWFKAKPGSSELAIYISNWVEECFQEDRFAGKVKNANLYLNCQTTKMRLTYYLDVNFRSDMSSSKALPNRLCRVRLDGKTSNSQIEIQFFRRDDVGLDDIVDALAEADANALRALDVWEDDGKSEIVLVVPVTMNRDRLKVIVRCFLYEALLSAVEA